MSKTIEGYVQREDSKTWYRITNPKAKKPPLLLLHGGPGFPHHYFEPLEQGLTDRPIVVYDQMGCGNSKFDDEGFEYSLDKFAKELDQVLSQLPINKPFHILGHSFGSTLLAYYRIHFDQKFLSTTYASPVINHSWLVRDNELNIANLPDSDRQKIEALGKNPQCSREEYWTAIKPFFDKHMCTIQWPAEVQESGKHSNGKCFNQMVGRSDLHLTGSLKGIDMLEELANRPSPPTLLIGGEHDEIPPSTLKEYSSKLKDSQVMIVENSAHFFFNEKPTDAINKIDQFLKETD